MPTVSYSVDKVPDGLTNRGLYGDHNNKD